MLLEVADLHVHYGRLAALRGISLTVDEGEIVCVVGPNGAGKSTTLLAISGALTPTSGSITMDDRAIGGICCTFAHVAGHVASGTTPPVRRIVSIVE